MSDCILEMRNFHGGYGNKQVLSDINFSMPKGEIIGIIGPNGCGKTTLLRAVTNIVKAGRGRVILDGNYLAKMSNREMAKMVAVVSQNPQIANINVQEFVLMGRIPYFSRMQFLESTRDVEIALHYMQLTDTLKLKSKSLTDMSGGERQLAAIARALTQEPKLLLLDEPISNLDITHQVGIMDLLKKLNKEYGVSVITVLHDLNMASEYCDRLLLLNNGRIHSAGTPFTVLTYSIIEEVYKTVVVVEKNPISHKPYVLLVCGRELKEKEWQNH